jgi:hypothetical protein
MCKCIIGLCTLEWKIVRVCGVIGVVSMCVYSATCGLRNKWAFVIPMMPNCVCVCVRGSD